MKFSFGFSLAEKLAKTLMRSFFLQLFPGLQESQILQNSSEILVNFAFLTSLYKNRKLCKFVTMSNISYKILITFSAKNAFFLVRNSYKKCDVLFRPKNQKSSNYQQQQPQLPFTMHKLSPKTPRTLQLMMIGI